jgi:hypothetical protein
MSKKSFTEGAAKIFSPSTPQTVEQPIAEKRGPGRPKSEETENEERATFILRSDLIEDIKNISYWERRLLKETVNGALKAYVEDYKSSHKGVIEERPDDVKARDSKRSNAGRR